MTLFAENFLNERVIMKIRLNKPFFIKGLAVVYAVLMLLILFGRTSYNIGKPYWEQLQLNINLVPFYTISQYLYLLLNRSNEHLIFHAFINLVGNIVIFIPLGGLLPSIFKSLQKIIPFLLCVILIIIGIECIQLFTLTGSCDIDDFILNFLGVPLGNLLFRLCHKNQNSIDL